LDSVKWYISPNREVQPLCPKHHIRLSLGINNNNDCYLKCAECEHVYSFPREFNEQKRYVLNKLDSKILRI